MKSLQLLPRLWQPEHSCDLPAQSPPHTFSFTSPGYQAHGSMIEPPSPEETERQREKNRKLREQLMRIQRPTEISVPQGEWCCCTTFLIAYHFANEVYGCISVCTIHYHSCVNGFLPGPPMMSYSLPPAAGSSTSSLASLEPASSLLPPLSSLSLQQSQPSLSLSQFRPPPQTSTILSSLTQQPPLTSTLLDAVSSFCSLSSSSPSVLSSSGLGGSIILP